MKELTKIEGLREIFTDDNKAIKIFDKLCRKNRKSIKRYIFVLTLTIIYIILFLLFILFHKKIFLYFGVMIATTLILFKLCDILLERNAVTTDELKYLNTILEEKTLERIGEIPFVKKGDKLFCEKDGKILYIGYADRFLDASTQYKYRYKTIEDYAGIIIPRFRVEQVEYIKKEKKENA